MYDTNVTNLTSMVDQPLVSIIIVPSFRTQCASTIVSNRR